MRRVRVEDLTLPMLKGSDERGKEDHMTTESAQPREREKTLLPLSSYEFVLLTTMRKSGIRVPTAMWFAYEQGKL